MSGKHVTLVPLAPEHTAALAAAVHSTELPDLWFTNVPSAECMQAEVERRLRLQAEQSMLPFTVIEPRSGEIVGMTAYMNIDAPNRRLEIGSTWYAERVQRTGLNTESKLLLLQRVFTEFGCNAVELRTHFMNQRSRRAIERLGAKLDGVLRSHQVLPNGTVRDTCVYSILAGEWPAVEANLRWQLKRAR